MRRRKFTPYIRRLRPSDKSGSIRVALKLILYEAAGYVLVQHGVSGVLNAASSRQQLIDSLAGARTVALRSHEDWKHPKTRHFREWAARVGRSARA